MLGQMMRQPLLVSNLLVHAERHHGTTEIVSRRVEGDLHRTNYAELASRARRLANALWRLGVTRGDRVGTLAWNGYRHLELYYAVSGSGAVIHTLNPRLHLDQLAWMLEHAGDKVVFFDLTFGPLVEELSRRVPSVEAWIPLCATGRLDELGASRWIGYEELLAGELDDFEWPALDEDDAAALCYTSGTTGDPKGVLYSHRSTVLHAMSAALPDAFACSARDTILPVVPMFHVNAWGLPYIACMVGAKLVFPGPALDGASLHTLFESEGVTLSAGVPTIWQGLLGHVRANGLGFATMRRTIVGGAACPPAMTREFQQEHGVEVTHAWGMTELSPLGTACTPKRDDAKARDADARLALQSRQGRVVFGIDMKIVGPDGAELAWDGVQAGELMVRGPWVVASYLKNAGGDPLVRDAAGRGWFPTGDIATIDPDGFMQVTDRAKDVIKSGGEWIGSIDLENVAMAHPSVAMAACIGVPHPKWDERPLLVVVRKPGQDLSREELLAAYEGRVAKWWTPDDVAFVESIPLGATGKMLKARLREQFRDRFAPSPSPAIAS